MGPLSYLRGGNGPTLVLLHGAPGSARTWARASTLLAPHFDVILPDLHGFGESVAEDPKPQLDHDFYLEAHAEAVHRLLQSVNVDTLHLGGHDFGGRVAITLLRLFADYTVDRLILSATNLFTDSFVPLPFRVAGVPVLGGTAFWLMTGTRPGLHALYWAAVYNKATFRRSDFAKHLTPDGIDQTKRIFQRSLSDLPSYKQPLEALLPHLDMPTLVLWGNQDPFFPHSEGLRLVNTIPNATFSRFQETGHFVPEERPELTAWHVGDFLKGRSIPLSGWQQPKPPS